jgi:hypothetical protein
MLIGGGGGNDGGDSIVSDPPPVTVEPVVANFQSEVDQMRQLLSAARNRRA